MVNAKAYNRDLTGQKFGKLTATDKAHPDRFGKSHWNCLCECGNTARVAERRLITGGTNSCGCIQKKHGCFGHPLYGTWNGIMQRCNNPKHHAYSDYGGRGIKVCERWHDVRNFIEDVEPTYVPGLEIDRINNNGNYEPDNCHWVTRTENARNRRNNVLVLGEPLSVHAERTGLSRSTIQERLDKGMSELDAVTLPAERIRLILGKPISYWAKERNIPIQTIRKRLQLGKTDEEAIDPNYVRAKDRVKQSA